MFPPQSGAAPSPLCCCTASGGSSQPDHTACVHANSRARRPGLSAAETLALRHVANANFVTFRPPAAVSSTAADRHYPRGSRRCSRPTRRARRGLTCGIRSASAPLAIGFARNELDAAGEPEALACVLTPRLRHRHSSPHGRAANFVLEAPRRAPALTPSSREP